MNRLLPWGSLASTSSIAFSLPAPLLTRRESAPIDDTLLYAAWELSRWDSHVPEPHREAVCFLLLALLLAEREGSTLLETGSSGSLERMLDALATPNEVRAYIRGLTSDTRGSTLVGPENGPLVTAGPLGFAWTRYHNAERRISTFVHARLGTLAGCPRGVEEALADVMGRPHAARGAPVRLSEEQQNAVRACVGSPLHLVIGGPGTGKTSILVSLVRTLVRLGVQPDRIALSAPTGKAARRMRESIGESLASIVDPSFEDKTLLSALPEPCTLHRLLEFSPSRGTYGRNERAPLSATVLVVDEASMLDVRAMDRLTLAIAPDTKVVLVGDALQLPSVDAGAVLRDLVEVCPAPNVTQLSRPYRVQSVIGAEPNPLLALSDSVRAGRFVSGLLPRVGDEDWSLDTSAWLPAGDTSSIRRALLRWVDLFFATQQDLPTLGDGGSDLEARAALALRISNRSRVLSPIRSADPRYSSDAINRLAGQRWATLLGHNPKARPRFLPGEPVMITVNDYERSLFNGTQGVALRWGDTSPHTALVFPSENGPVVMRADSAPPHVEGAFALTVHKSQGSEHDHVLFVVPPERVGGISQNLVYTAITRARIAILLIAEQASLAQALASRKDRDTALGQLLATKRDAATVATTASGVSREP